MSNNSRPNADRAPGLGLYPTTSYLFGPSTDPGTSGTPHFTADDRTTLRLIYHQQQALQVQLNTVLTWMQQLDQRLATMERLRQPEAQEPTTVSNRDRSRHTSEVGSRPNISAIGESRSCTPPGEDTNQSALNRSVESASGAAPWDPSNHAAVDTSRTSHTSQLGRQENPLLSSRLSAAPSQRPASKNASRIRSHPQSTNTTVLSAGYSAEQSHISQPQPERALRQPPQQQQQQQPVLAPAMTATGDRGIPTYRRPLSAPADPSLAQRPLPPKTSLHSVEKYSTGSATPTEHIKPQQAPAQRSTTVSPQDGTPTTGSGTTQRTRVFYDPKGRADLDYDSLSDGYGSYESRQYIKQIGLL